MPSALYGRHKGLRTNPKTTNQLIKIVELLTADIRLDFGPDKCRLLNIGHGKVEIEGSQTQDKIAEGSQTQAEITESTAETDTYLLTPQSRVLLEKLTSFQLVKEFPAFYGTGRFITAFTSVLRSYQSMSPGPRLL